MWDKKIDSKYPTVNENIPAGQVSPASLSIFCSLCGLTLNTSADIFLMTLGFGHCLGPALPPTPCRLPRCSPGTADLKGRNDFKEASPHIKFIISNFNLKGSG